MAIKIESLKTFLTVASSGTLTEAAEILQRTPSAISMTLKQLEQELGQNLFVTDRKSALTPMGQYVLDEGKKAVGDFDASMMAIKRFAEGDNGTIKLAAVPSIATRLLPSVVTQFHQTSKNVRIELRDMDSSMVAAAVRNGSVDFGIASLTQESHDLDTKLILEEPFGLICRKDHKLAAAKKPVTWQTLWQENFLSNGICALIKDPSFQRIVTNCTIHIHNTSTLLSFIEKGLGVTLLPRMALPQEGASNLAFVPIADKTAIRSLHLILQKHHLLNPASEELVKSILEWMQLKSQ